MPWCYDRSARTGSTVITAALPRLWTFASNRPSPWRFRASSTSITTVLDPSADLAVARIGTLIALVCDSGVESSHPITGTVYAVDLETNSAFLCIADILVSGSVCFAPSFEHDRCDEMHGLRGRAFICSQGDLHAAEQEVRSSICFSGSTGFSQAAPRSICPQRSPASYSLEIEFKRSK